MNDAVITALEETLKATPSNHVLRIHLIDLLLGLGNGARAMEHCAEILRERPDDVAGLQRAANAAELLGETSRAAAYRRTAEALSGAPTPAPAAAAEPAPVSATTPVIPVKPSVPETKENDDAPSNVVRLRAVDNDEQANIEVQFSDITLADVAGMDDVKRRLNVAFLAPMRNPEMRKLYGKKMRGGLMLYGPPGCGKTYIARAVAGELGARFISLGLSDVLDMYFGQSEKNLHEVFETARRAAPCVLFFDEADALGRKRSLQRHSTAGSNVVNQMLSEMDGVGQTNEGVFVLAATNHPWDVDAALRRPGRFDRVLLVLPPDKPARARIVQTNFADRPTTEIDFDWIASKTEDYSGADLAHLCEAAAEIAMEESVASGKARPINMSDVKKALKDVRPSTRAWFDTAKNYVQFANEGGMYDELQTYMRSRRFL